MKKKSALHCRLICLKIKICLNSRPFFYAGSAFWRRAKITVKPYRCNHKFLYHNDWSTQAWRIITRRDNSRASCGARTDTNYIFRASGRVPRTAVGTRSGGGGRAGTRYQTGHRPQYDARGRKSIVRPRVDYIPQ